MLYLVYYLSIIEYNMSKPSKESCRTRFFQFCVQHPKIKETISGDNEKKVIDVLVGMGYKIGSDFVRQYPVADMFVIDIAFVKEQVAIEVDGESHDKQKQRIKDDKRDRFLRENNWVSIRIKDRDFFGYKASLYKSLIKLIVDERKEQWNLGQLFPIEFTTYYENDYE